jgi:hypothetical protein
MNRRTFVQKMTQAGCAGLVLSRWPELPGPTGNYTFLFQGDSITDGNRSRNADWNHVLGHGYAYLIASRLWYDHPSSGFHFFNRGSAATPSPTLPPDGRRTRWISDRN